MGHWVKVVLLISCLFLFSTAEISFDQVPRDVLIAEGSRAVFNCSIFTLTGAILIWRKGSEQVDSSGRANIAVNGTLTIDPTESGDDGTYTCNWSTARGAISSSAVLRFAYLGSSIARSPESQTVVEGSSVSLLCLHSDSLPAANLSWLQNGSLVTPADHPRYAVSMQRLSATSASSTLFITAARPADRGMYTCRVSNALLPGRSVDSAAATLTVTVVPRAPTVTDSPDNVTISFEGGEGSFRCAFTGEPPPSVVWLKDGMSVNPAGQGLTISSSADASTLTIASVDPSHAGTYQCRLSNSLGQVTSAAAYLELASIGLVFQTPPTDVEAILGLNATIVCDPPQSTPGATVSWRKDFTQLRPPRFAVTSDHDLQISSVQLTDAGGYSCTATNPVSGTARISDPAQLTVLTPPSISQGPQNTSAAEETTAIFSCVASGNPVPVIKWLGVSSVEISTSSKYVISGTELRVLSVARGDEGRYTCVADTRAGVARQHAFLNVQYAPEVLTSLVTVTVVAGQPAVLPCHLGGNPTTSYMWQRQQTGEDIQTGQNSSFSISSIGSLTVVSTQKSDEGSFQCSLTNFLGTASSSVQLVVQVPASIVATATPVTVVTGNSVSLSCGASGDPPPAVQWSLNGQALPDQSLSARVSLANGNQTLTFLQALNSDEGTYACTATNSIQSDSDVVQLIVFVPPTIASPPTSVDVVEGGTVLLDCASSGDPPPGVSWSRDGRAVNLTSTTAQLPNGSLSLSSIHEGQEGMYSCVASNLGGQASLSHQVDVKVPAEASLPSNVSLISGTSGRIDCVTRGDPAPSVSWFQPDGTMVTTSSLSRIRYLGNGTLVFTTVQASDVGSYTCEVVNSLGRDSAIVGVFVAVPPSAGIAASEVRIVVRTNVTLVCATSGTPPPVITWSKDSAPIAFSNRIFQTGGNLQINLVSHSDGGSYRCVAGNEVGTASDAVDLVTLELPTAVTPSMVPVVAGQQASISCLTTGVPPPAINWFNPEEIKLLNTATTTIATNGSLIFTLATQQDGGMFRCTATNEVGIATASVVVTVNVHPIISAVNRQVAGVVGDSANLECVANGNPTPIVTWQKDNADILNPRIFQQSAILSISPVALGDEGVYTCSATNIVGVAEDNVTVVVQERPLIQTRPSNQIVHVNQSVTLFCNASGKPLPQLSWLHNNTIISGETGTSLSIAMVTAGSEGMYTCTASNAVGLDVAMATLSLLYPPSAPTIQTLVANAPTSIIVTWVTSGNGGSPITGFLINYHPTSGGSVATVTVFSPLITMATVSGLLPYTEYEVTIQAVNVVGSSEVNAGLMERTFPTAPSLPRNVRISGSAQFSFTVSWDQPDPLNGPLFAYSVRHRVEGGAESTSVTLTGTFTVPGVVLGSVYVFGVRAGTTRGFAILWGGFVEIRVQDGVIIETILPSVSMDTSTVAAPTATTAGISSSIQAATTTAVVATPTSSLVATTTITAPPPPTTTTTAATTTSTTSSVPPTPSQTPISNVVPTDLRVGSQPSANSAFISWNAPVESVNGFLGYRIFVSPPPPSTNEPFEVPFTRTSLFLTNLAFVTPYTVSVSVYSSVGNGVQTAPVSLTTGEGSPSAPTNVQVQLLSPTSARVTWESPDPANGVITQYDIRLLDIQDNIARTVTVGPLTDGTSFVLQGLFAGRRYSVTVRAQNTLLIGVVSQAVLFEAIFVPVPTTTMTSSSSSSSSSSSLAIVASSDITTDQSSSSADVRVTSTAVAETVRSTAIRDTPSSIAVSPSLSLPPSEPPGLSPENLVAVCVLGGIFGLVLCIVLSAIVVVIARKCCCPAKPKKWDVYNRMEDHHHRSQQRASREPDRAEKYLAPTRDSGSSNELGYPLYQTGNFTFNGRNGDAERDSPHEASDFSDFDQLDDHENESERFQRSNPRYVGVSDTRRLVPQSPSADPTHPAVGKRKKQRSRPSREKTHLPVVEEEMFDDVGYAQVTHVQEKSAAVKKGPKKSSNLGILTSDPPPPPQDPSTAVYADIDLVKNNKRRERAEKAAKRASKDTLDSQATSSVMYSSRETLDSQRGGGARGRGSRDTLDSNQFSDGYSQRDSQTTDSLHAYDSAGQRSSGESGGQRSSGDSRGQRSSGESGGQRSSGESGGQRSSGESGGQRSSGDSRGQRSSGESGDHRSGGGPSSQRWSGNGLPEHYF